jgi:hypothetical protein
MRKPLKRTLVPLALPLLLAVLTGCQGAIVGHWKLHRAIPNPSIFSIDDAAFRRDGTFDATTTIEGRTAEETGTYDFNGFKLKLRPAAGGQRAYIVHFEGGRLVLKHGDARAILRKTRGGS